VPAVGRPPVASVRGSAACCRRCPESRGLPRARMLRFRERTVTVCRHFGSPIEFITIGWTDHVTVEMGQVKQSSTVEGEMTDDALVAFVEERAGETLRVIAEIEQPEYTVRYRRNDLQRDEVVERMDRIHGEGTVAWNMGTGDALAGVGEKRATVEIREEAVIVHLLVEAGRRYVLEFEHSAARNLTSFLGECFEHTD
jgi:hypothetical protein